MTLFQQILTEKKREILQNVKERSQEKDDMGSYAKDPGDKALFSYEKEHYFQLTDSEQKLLKLIDEALERMLSGNFGICVECKKPIQDTRLNAIPWARHCVQCQELQEKGTIR